MAGFAVTVAWTTLALSGRWAASRDRPDRLGLVLGVCWIAIALIEVATAWWAALPF